MTRAYINMYAHTSTRVLRRARLFTCRGAPVWMHRAGFISFSLQPSFSSSAYLHRTHASAVTGSLHTSPLPVIFFDRRGLLSSSRFRIDFIRRSISSYLSALLFLFHSPFILSFAFSFFRFSDLYNSTSALIVRYYISIRR